jgi:8-oxo-dGTP pyrophosphatase MutT (NUDIX family)
MENLHSHRVRAVLLTNAGGVMLIKRLRPGMPAYWVAAGGGIEPTDASPEDALSRELSEELGAEAEIGSIAFSYLHPSREGGLIRQTFYICHLKTYDLSQRHGPEWSGQGHGEYIPDEIPLKPLVIGRLNIRPEALRYYLLDLAGNQTANAAP